jgi:UDP-sulfoquinovose synthase
VHGTGGQTRAFIHVRDTVRCIEIALNNAPDRGEQVSVFNQVTETYRVRDLAELISSLTGVEIAYLPNPRKEAPENDLNVTRDRFMALGLSPTTLSEGLIEETREIGAKYASRAELTKIVAKTVWNPGMEIPADLTEFSKSSEGEAALSA